MSMRYLRSSSALIAFPACAALRYARSRRRECRSATPPQGLVRLMRAHARRQPRTSALGERAGRAAPSPPRDDALPMERTESSRLRGRGVRAVVAWRVAATAAAAAASLPTAVRGALAVRRAMPLPAAETRASRCAARGTRGMPAADGFVGGCARACVRACVRAGAAGSVHHIPPNTHLGADELGEYGDANHVARLVGRHLEHVPRVLGPQRGQPLRARPRAFRPNGHPRARARAA
jgi:hypothetical protein